MSPITPESYSREALRPSRSGGRQRLGRNLVRRSGRRDGWSLFGLLGRLAVGFSHGRRPRVRGRLRDLGETFHGDSLAQNLASGLPEYHRTDGSDMKRPPSGPARQFAYPTPRTGRTPTSFPPSAISIGPIQRDRPWQTCTGANPNSRAPSLGSTCSTSRTRSRCPIMSTASAKPGFRSDGPSWVTSRNESRPRR